MYHDQTAEDYLAPFLAAKGETFGETFATWSPILRRAKTITVQVAGRNDTHAVEITYQQARLLLLSAGGYINDEFSLILKRWHPGTLDDCYAAIVANS